MSEVELNAQERKAIARKVPWVRYLRKTVPCTGFMARTPLKAVYAMGGKPPVGLDNYRCKQPARWKFTALQRSYASDGTYCWSHLLSRGFYGDMAECDRLNRWLERHEIRTAEGRQVRA